MCEFASQIESFGRCATAGQWFVMSLGAGTLLAVLIVGVCLIFPGKGSGYIGGPVSYTTGERTDKR